MAFYMSGEFVVSPQSPGRERHSVYENETLVIIIDSEAGYKGTPHSHTWATMYYVMNGEGRARVGDEWRDISAGTLVMIPANTMHGLESKTAMKVFEVQCNCPASFAEGVLGRAIAAG